MCGLIDEILRAEYAGYEEARARGCTAASQATRAAAEETATADRAVTGEGKGRAALEGAEAATPAEPAALVGHRVELHSLTSTAGRQLNGLRGQVEAFDAAAARLVVRLDADGGNGSRQVRTRAANVRVVEESGGRTSSSESYTHFGRGCDGCGVYPVVGRCYRCRDCSEAIGCGSAPRTPRAPRAPCQAPSPSFVRPPTAHGARRTA